MATTVASGGLKFSGNVCVEWYSCKLMRELRERLTAERVEACRAIPGGEVVLGKPSYTDAERALLRVQDRLERLRMLESQLSENTYDGEKVRTNWVGERQPVGGKFALHMSGRVKWVRVRYGRAFGVGRQYVMDHPTITKPASERGEMERDLSATAQGMSADMRAALMPMCHDVDIVSCHPSIFRTMARRVGVAVPSLDDYVLRPKYWRREVVVHHQLASGDDDPAFDAAMDKSKRLFTSLVYGGKYETRLWEWDRRSDARLPFVTKLEKELQLLRDTYFAHSSHRNFFSAMMERQRGRKTKKRGPDGELRKDASGRVALKSDEEVRRATWAHFAFTLEDGALQAMKRSFEKQGFTIYALVFDGCMIMHNPEVDVALAIETAQREIVKTTGLDIKIIEKKLYDPELVSAMQ